MKAFSHSRVLRRSSPHELGSGDLGPLREWFRRSAAADTPVSDARELVARYRHLSDEGRTAFLTLLATDFATPDDVAVATARRILAAGSASAAREVRSALEPPCARVLRRLGAVEGGVEFLVDLRAELRALVPEQPALAALEQDLRDLLSIRFDSASLDLRRITWDAPASLLETIASLEAVHAVRGWDDLKNRVDADRRFYAFFHPLLRDRPLLLAQVAITRGLAADIATLLDPTAPTVDPEQADTAIFYSISNTHPGLSGLNIGTTLIKRAIGELKREFPGLKTYATLSPMPGFVGWLEKRPIGDGVDGGALAKAAAAGDESAREPLLRLGARYLLQAKRAGGGARDPVANFHLSNGARIGRLNWRADVSAAGIRASAGLMVNYLYPLNELERNRVHYLEAGSVVTSAAVTRLARQRVNAVA